MIFLVTGLSFKQKFGHPHLPPEANDLWVDSGTSSKTYVTNVTHLKDAKRSTPRKMNGWNLNITQLKRKIIFQTSILGFHVNFPGCRSA